MSKGNNYVVLMITIIVSLFRVLRPKNNVIKLTSDILVNPYKIKHGSQIIMLLSLTCSMKL